MGHRSPTLVLLIVVFASTLTGCASPGLARLDLVPIIHTQTWARLGTAPPTTNTNWW